MKKTIIGTVIMIAVVMTIYILSNPVQSRFFAGRTKLGNINKNYSDLTTNTSEISFLGETDDEIRFEIKSNIKNGDLDLILCNSDGSEVYHLPQAKDLIDYFTLNHTDTYTLVAECTNFIGKYEIKVYKMK